MDFSNELAEYRLFASTDDFLNNRCASSGPIGIKGERIIVPKLKKAHITYVRTKRLGLLAPISDNGSILVIHDSSAYAEISAELFQSVMFRKKGMYLKEQSLNLYRDTDRFVVGYHFPHWVTFKYMKKDLNTNRPIDLMYAGKQRKQRNGVYKDMYKAAKSMRLNACLTQSKKQIDRVTGVAPSGLLQPRDYVQKMRQSKICYSLVGTGYRSHRDWEALLCGAFLLNDSRSTRCCQFKGLVLGKHFIEIDHANVARQLEYWLKHEDERISIAKQGYDAAWKIWYNAIDQWHPIRKLAYEQINKNGW